MLLPERVPAADFEAALQAMYREQPCAVLPNALWKTMRMIRDAAAPALTVAVDRGSGAVAQLVAHDDRRLLVHWHREDVDSTSTFSSLTEFQLLLLHDRDVSNVPRQSFGSPERYFRLIHRGAAQIRPLPDRFFFREVGDVGEMATVADFINRCYGWTSLTGAVVGTWTKHPVYAPDLWLWVMDGQTGAPAALGIAELDGTVPEASLEWIQVLPTYRRRGLGAALVCELLRRVEGRADLTTVAGQIDNESHPEALYRRCGFEGDDIWCVFRRDDASG